MALQDHIHIDTSVGGAPENSPALKWKTTRRALVPTVFVSADRGLLGDLQVQYLADGANPAQFMDYEYTVLVRSNDDLNTLLGLQGKLIKFVDHDHVVDGSDHTSYVKDMLFFRVTEIQNLDPWFTHTEVDIIIRDKDTVIT